jgi:hypothetical protein
MQRAWQLCSEWTLLIARLTSEQWLRKQGLDGMGQPGGTAGPHHAIARGYDWRSPLQRRLHGIETALAEHSRDSAAADQES